MGLFNFLTKSLVGEATNNYKSKKNKESEERKNLEMRYKAEDLVSFTKKHMKDFVSVSNELLNETKELIEKESGYKERRLTFKEKKLFNDLSYETTKKFKYLYLVKDYFTFASKISAHATLETDQYIFIIKFAPFFDGKKVLDCYDDDDDDDDDDSLFGVFKDIGKELIEDFIPTPKGPKKFSFDDYIYNYRNEIIERKIPNINLAINRFIEANNKKSTNSTKKNNNSYIICPSCHTQIKSGSNFCPECGAKIKTTKKKVCPKCGEEIDTNVKFCHKCGQKL